MASTDFSLDVENGDGRPVSGATVTLVLDGAQISKSGDRTDSKGTIKWSWPSKNARLSGWCTARKGATSAKESVWVAKNEHKQFLLVLESPNAASSAAEARWKDRERHPINQRTERELLQDLAWGLGITGDIFKRMELARKKMGMSGSPQVVASNSSKASRFLYSASSFKEAAIGIHKNWKMEDTFTKIGRAAGVVGGVYAFVDSIRDNNPAGALRAMASVPLIASFHPLGATLLIGVNLAYGLTALATPFAAGLPKVTEAVVRQKFLPQLNHIASCQADKGHRIDLSKIPYGVKKSWKAGLAFDNSGGLVLAVGARTTVPVPTPNWKAAKRVRGTMNDASTKGWL